MAAITTAAIGVGLGGFQAISGAVNAKKAKNELANLKVPELDNAFEDLQISTIGSDLMKEESQRTTATAVDAYRSGGVRSVMGGIPQIVAMNNDANKEARMYLDDQVQKRNYAIAKDNQNIRNMVENRYMGDVQGLNNRIQESRQDMWSGLRGVFSGIGAMARGIEADSAGGYGIPGNVDGSNAGRNLINDPFNGPTADYSYGFIQ